MRPPKAIIELAHKCGFAGAIYFGKYGKTIVYEPVSDEQDDPLQPTGLPTVFLWEDKKAKEICGIETFEIYDKVEAARNGEDEKNWNKAPIIVDSKPSKCSLCGGKIVYIMYGEPSVEAGKKADRKELLLGGCCRHIEGDPQWGCVECGQRFWKK